MHTWLVAGKRGRQTVLPRQEVIRGSNLPAFCVQSVHDVPADEFAQSRICSCDGNGLAFEGHAVVSLWKPSDVLTSSAQNRKWEPIRDRLTEAGQVGLDVPQFLHAARR